MKIRQGFVSNSSSTSFTFVFNGDSVDDLCKVLEDYKNYFELSFENWDGRMCSCNFEDIKNSLKNVVLPQAPEDKDKYFDVAYPIPIQQEIDNLTEEALTEGVLTSDYVHDVYLYDLSSSEAAANLRKSLIMVNSAEKGLNRVIKVDFGDNHGHVCGGDVGIAMDYVGRNIEIIEDDLVVITEQNR